MKPNRKSSKAGRKVRNSESGPGLGATNYSGPLRVPGGSSGANTVLKRHTTVGAVTSTAGSVINNIFTSSPTASSQWGNDSVLFDAYRVLGFIVRFVPNNPDQSSLGAPGPSTSTLRGYIASVVDLDDATAALTSGGLAYRNPSCKLHMPNKQWAHSARAKGPELMQFSTTAGAPSTVFSIKLFSDQVGASTQYGVYFQDWLIEFRGPI